jgi:hypothetical protein
VVGCHSFCLFFIFYNIHTFIQSHSYTTFIRRHSPGPLSIPPSHLSSVGKTSLWCRDENQTRAAENRTRVKPRIELGPPENRTRATRESNSDHPRIELGPAENRTRAIRESNLGQPRIELGPRLNERGHCLCL